MKSKVLGPTIQAVTLAFAFLAPVIFIPSFTDSYDFGRQIFVLAAVFIIFCLWAVNSLVEKKLVFQKNSYFWPAALLFLAFAASSLINAPNKTVSFAATIGPASFLLLLLTLIISSNTAKPKLTLYAFLADGVVLTIVSLVLFLGKFKFPLSYTSWNLAIDKSWSPTGNLLSQAIFLLLLIPIGFALVYEEVQKKNLRTAALIFLANTLILSGLGVALYLLTAEAKPILLPQQTAWSIAAETMKNTKFAILGMGPGQFLNAFTSFKPLSFNNGNFWNLRFAVSSNWYFQLLTEVGLIGLFLYLNLAIKIFKNGLKTLRENKISALNIAIYSSLGLFLIVQFIFPINLSLLVVFFLLLGLVENKEERKVFDLATFGNLVIVFLAIPLIIWGALFYFAGKIALANYYFLSSARAAAQNDGITTYNMQIKAIQTDPSSITYRIAYSQTNLALANSLAGKKDLSDNDRSTITQLVQQSLREAKAAVAIDPANANAWENLSTIYRSLINFAQGADQWTIASYQQAIQSDPLNPRLRIDLGGIYYSQKNFNQAANLFLQATNLKNDYANAHYNLANALREMGALADAKKEYEVAQTLVKVDSNDYQKVTSELEEVKKRLPTPTPTPSSQKPGKPETLSTPQAPSAGIKPPLNLPNEGPPVSITPSPSAPTVSPTP